MSSAEVCLVEVPFSLYAAPALSLSILKACLNRAGIKSELLYGNMAFSVRNNTDYVRSFQWLPQQTCIGDAVFAEAAWERPMAEEYKALLKEDELYASFFMAATAHIFERLQREAVPFIEEFGQLILAKRPKIVAIASMFSQNNAAIALAKYIKKKSPETVTMIGGANAVGETAWGLAKCPGCFDYVFSGEADEIFADVCERIIRNGNIPKNELPYGVLTSELELDGKNVPIRHTVDLNTIPYPDYDDYFAQLKEYGLAENVRPGLFMEFSRGCWWNMKRPCTFCGLNNGNHKYRIKSSDRVLKELDYLLERYREPHMMITDNILSAVHLKEVMPKIAERKEKVYFYGEVKTDISDENIRNLAKAGFTHLQPGIESLQDEVLALMNKGASGLHQIAFLKRLKNAGINAHWNILSGFPGEKPEYYEEMAKIIPLIMHYNGPTRYSSIVFSRSSVYTEMPEKYGLNLKPYRFYEPCFPDKDFLRMTAEIYQPVDKEQALIMENITMASPAHAEVKKLTDRWLLLNMRRPERLVATKRDGSIEIMDMRKAAVKPFFTLTGLAMDIALATDTEIKREKLTEKLAERYAEADIEEKTDWLKDMKLLLEMRGELLFLPTWNDAPAYPPESEKPRGYLFNVPELDPAECKW